MKTLSVPLVETRDDIPLFELAEAPWKEYPYKPNVKFGIAHSGTEIFLKFVVDEQALRCETTETNGPVWEDSCVEFFIGFDDSGYYNLEFNCIGTARVAFGKERENRTVLPRPVVERLVCHTHSHENTHGDFHWELGVTIPVSIFLYHTIEKMDGTLAHGNFYKCGDLTPQPHFLCWNHIDSPSPNFHLSQFFGALTFEG